MLAQPLRARRNCGNCLRHRSALTHTSTCWLTQSGPIPSSSLRFWSSIKGENLSISSRIFFDSVEAVHVLQLEICFDNGVLPPGLMLKSITSGIFCRQKNSSSMKIRNVHTLSTFRTQRLFNLRSSKLNKQRNRQDINSRCYTKIQLAVVSHQCNN